MREVKANISVTIKEDGEIMASAISSNYHDVNTPRKIWKFNVFSKNNRGYIEVKTTAFIHNIIQEKPDIAIPWTLVFERMKWVMYQLATEEV